MSKKKEEGCEEKLRKKETREASDDDRQLPK